MKTQTDLTSGNAHLASTIISKANPEWGTKRFNYQAQQLNDGKLSHTVGIGSSSSLLFDSDFKFWSIVTFKELKAFKAYIYDHVAGTKIVYCKALNKSTAKSYLMRQYKVCHVDVLSECFVNNTDLIELATF